MTRATAAPVDEAPLSFAGDFSFINMHGRDLSQEQRETISWHVLHRYEPFKKQRRAEMINKGPTSEHDPEVTYMSPSGTSTVSEGRASASPGVEALVGDRAWPHLNLPSSRSSFPVARRHNMESFKADSANSVNETGNVNLRKGSGEYVAEDLLVFGRGQLLPHLWPQNPKILHERIEFFMRQPAFSAPKLVRLANFALLSTLAGYVYQNHNLVSHSRLLQMQAIDEIDATSKRPERLTVSTLRAILNVCSCESVAGNTRQARMQLKLLRSLTEKRGGVIHLDPSLREDVLSVDCYFALKYGTRPIFPSKDWSPGRLSEPWRSQLERLESRDCAPSVSYLLGEFLTLRLILGDLQELFAVNNGILQRQFPQDEQLLQWHRFRKLDCISRLADHFVNVSLYGHQYRQPEIEAFCAAAAALLTIMILGSPEPCTFGTAMMGALRKKLEKTASNKESARYNPLRLWALYIGSLAEKVYPTLREAGSQPWFQMELALVSWETNVTEWRDLESILRGVLYDQRLQHEVESGTPSRSSDFIPGLYTACEISWRLPLSTGALVTPARSPHHSEGNQKLLT